LTLSRQRETVNASLDVAKQQYQQGVWRARVFRDLILADIEGRKNPVVLDIGCGSGFDGSSKLQTELARAVGSGQYWGIEPDSHTKLDSATFTTVHRCFFEDAPVPPSSVDVAFCVMVLEHIVEPKLFFSKVAQCLKPGGVFWGVTVNARHPFAQMSTLFEKTGIKDRYLNWLHGQAGEDRYQNFPTHYRVNTTPEIEQVTQGFADRLILDLWSPRQLDFYFPPPLRFLSRGISHLSKASGRGGSLLLLRLER